MLDSRGVVANDEAISRWIDTGEKNPIDLDPVGDHRQLGDLEARPNLPPLHPSRRAAHGRAVQRDPDRPRQPWGLLADRNPDGAAVANRDVRSGDLFECPDAAQDQEEGSRDHQQSPSLPDRARQISKSCHETDHLHRQPASVVRRSGHLARPSPLRFQSWPYGCRSIESDVGQDQRGCRRDRPGLCAHCRPHGATTPTPALRT